MWGMSFQHVGYLRFQTDAKESFRLKQPVQLHQVVSVGGETKQGLKGTCENTLRHDLIVWVDSTRLRRRLGMHWLVIEGCFVLD